MSNLTKQIPLRIPLRIYALLALLALPLLALLIPPATFAQSTGYTTVTGTILDPTSNPYRFGSGTATFVPGNPSQVSLLNGSPFQRSVSLQADINGTFTISLASNSLITPAGSQWKFSVNNFGSTVGFTFTTSISGTSQDLSTLLQANSISLGFTDVHFIRLFNQLPPPSAPLTGYLYLYSKQADNRLYYKAPDGTEIGPLGTGSAGNGFSSITSGTNTAAAMLCGTGCSIGPTGTGSITAGKLSPAGTSGNLATWGSGGAITDSGNLPPASLASASHTWLNSFTASTGLFTQTQPSLSDINGTYTLPLSLTSNTLSIANATTGSLGVLQLTADLGGTATSPSVLRVHGVSYPATGGSFDAIPILTASNSVSYFQINAGSSCGDATHALGYNQSTHLLNCQAITASATPGGSTTQLQYNNAGALGGISGLTFAGSTITGSGLTFDFSGSTLFRSRAAAGLTTTVNGDMGLDTTAGNEHVWDGTADRLMGIWDSSTPTNGDAVQISIASGKLRLHDSGVICCGSGGTPGGSNTQFQFNNSGAFAGTSGLTWNSSTAVPALARGAITSDINPFAISWITNNSGVIFNGLKLTVTNTAQAAGTMNYQFCGGAAGLTCFKLDTAANAYTPAAIATGGSTLANCTFGTGGGMCSPEGTTITPVAGWDMIVAASATHRWQISNNGSSYSDVIIRTDLPLIATTGSIGGAGLSAGACATGTVAVANSTTSMTVNVSPVSYPGDGFIWQGYVSSAGTVTVKVCAILAATPTASAYNVRVLQ